MRAPLCAKLAEARSAFVDEALSGDARDRLLAHLAGCAECRADIAELRQVRALLGQTRPKTEANPAPADLSHRLVSIAGQDARAPLWSRPFRQTAAGCLPSVRRAVRVRVTAAVVVAGSLVAGVAGIGYAAAPPLQLAAISDPTAEANAEFATSAQWPLASDAVKAVMMAKSRDLQTVGPAWTSATDPELSSAGGELTAAAALSTLEQSAWASSRVGYRGVQRVIARSDAGEVAADVRVEFEPGQGSQLVILGDQGTEVSEGFVPAPATSRFVDSARLALLAENYSLSGVSQVELLGRSATLVVAQDGAEVAARWWIDDQTGVILRHETYDSSGELVQGSTFTELQMGASEAFIDHLAPRLAVPTTTASLTLSSAGELTNHGWACEQQLVGMSLVRLRSDAATDPGALHLVYSDGVTTISVFEQKGALVAVGPKANWDHDLGAYRESGVLSSASWQSGTTVFTVVTDGPAEVLDSAVRSLPHVAPQTRTTMDRVQAGWSRIVDLVIR